MTMLRSGEVDSLEPPPSRDRNADPDGFVAAAIGTEADRKARPLPAPEAAERVGE